MSPGPRLGTGRRRCALFGLVLVLGVGGPVASTAAAGAARAGHATKQVGTPSQCDVPNPAVCGTVITGAGLSLHLRTSSEGPHNSLCQAGTSIPGTIGSSSSSGWCYLGDKGFLSTYADAVVNFSYDVYVPSRGGGEHKSLYYIDGYAKVPYLGFNEKSCAVHLYDGSDAGSYAPLTCTVDWSNDNGHGDNPQPVWRVNAR